MILLYQWSYKGYPFGEDQDNFWTANRGQRSKKGILGKFLHFLCDFLTVTATEFALELVYIIAFSTIYYVLSMRKNPNNFWDGMQRSKVKKQLFWWTLPYFIVILVCLVPEYTKKLVLTILFRPLANPGITYMVKWYVKWSESD